MLPLSGKRCRCCPAWLATGLQSVMMQVPEADLSRRLLLRPEAQPGALTRRRQALQPGAERPLRDGQRRQRPAEVCSLQGGWVSHIRR